MVDITTITSIFGGIESTVNILKAINATASSIKNAELKNQVAELLDLLANQKLMMAEVKSIILNRDQEIALLKKKIEEVHSSEKPVYQYGVYKFKGDDGNYCTQC